MELTGQIQASVELVGGTNYLLGDCEPTVSARFKGALGDKHFFLEFEEGEYVCSHRLDSAEGLVLRNGQLFVREGGTTGATYHRKDKNIIVYESMVKAWEKAGERK